MPEQLGGREMKPRLAGEGHDLNALHRIPAQLEEIILDTHLLNADDLRPDVRQDFLFPRAWGDELIRQLRPCLIGFRQRPPIHLAAGRQWHGVQPDISSRRHILGQLLFQKAAQFTDGRRPLRLGRFGDEIGYQALAAASVLSGQYYNLLDSRMLAQRRFNLSKLDAESAYLHLMVNAA